MSRGIFGFLMGGQLNKEAQLAAAKFDGDEVHLLKKTWQVCFYVAHNHTTLIDRQSS